MPEDALNDCTWLIAVGVDAVAEGPSVRGVGGVVEQGSDRGGNGSRSGAFVVEVDTGAEACGLCGEGGLVGSLVRYRHDRKTVRQRCGERSVSGVRDDG